ncbi:MFS transporter [Metarhizium album ARSEF 1941]|uniref:MFS transporter n=1 Tax=Metarhizium album (strain ARSEF 1941) TaxID=1081103 RepID=A0A0B2WWF6_METAS|nr:MFS transporter [Metarhizium album ARSEF 1941]KHN98393.1 MFS transporter [Metarhizium album ARSEF 1941]
MVHSRNRASGIAPVLFNFAWAQAPVSGWATPTVAVPLVLGLLLLAVFAVVELRLSRDPLLPLAALGSALTASAATGSRPTSGFAASGEPCGRASSWLPWGWPSASAFWRGTKPPAHRGLFDAPTPLCRATNDG